MTSYLSPNEQSRRRIAKMLAAKARADVAEAVAEGVPLYHYDGNNKLANVETIKSDNPATGFTYTYDETGRLADIQPAPQS
ncbi:hypothetical protein ACFRJ9_15970 [Paenarthrobacter sp. NPDC056912]|uniref:hypothetical protein n=1 Tax=Paenarthrobacter sp. NPDC056912 TaxID=3345965 RepID=UPI003670E292